MSEPAAQSVPAGAKPKNSQKAAVCEMVVQSPRKKQSSSSDAVQLVRSTISAADLEYIDTITCGNFTELIRTRRKDKDEIIVAKAFEQHVWRAEYLYSAELRFLRSVQGPWIIRFIGYIEDVEENFILLEYLPFGNLLQFCKVHQLQERQVRFYAAEMFLAVDFVHQNGFMHRNVMLSNFLLTQTGHVKLIDFGLSYKFRDPKASSKKVKPVTSPVFATTMSFTHWHSERSPRSSDTQGQNEDPSKEASQGSTSDPDPHKLPKAVEGNTSYCSPEVLKLVLPRSRFKRKTGYTHLCDYWSMGVAIYNMLYGRLPFEADTSGCVMDKVLRFKEKLTFPLNTDVTFEGSDFLRRLMTKEKRRLGLRGFEEVQNHSWFSSVDWSSLGTGSVSRPISLPEVERYTLSDERPSSSDKRSQSSRLSSGDDSDDDDLTDLNAADVSLTFNVPLCDDPTVPRSSPSCTTSSVEQVPQGIVARRTPTSRGQRIKNARAEETAPSHSAKVK